MALGINRRWQERGTWHARVAASSIASRCSLWIRGIPLLGNGSRRRVPCCLCLESHLALERPQCKQFKKKRQKTWAAAATAIEKKNSPVKGEKNPQVGALRYCYLRNCSRSLGRWENTCKRRFGEPLKGQVIRFGAMVEYHFLQKTSQGSINLLRKFLPDIFLGSALRAERIWQGDILVADIEELEKLDASEVRVRRTQCNRRSSRTKKKKRRTFPNRRWNLMFGRDCEVRGSLQRREQPVRSEDLREELQGNSERSQPTDETDDDAEALSEFWSIEGDFFHRHHIEPRVPLYVPKQEAFPIPWT